MPPSLRRSNAAPATTPIMAEAYLLSMRTWPFIDPVTPLEKEA